MTGPTLQLRAVDVERLVGLLGDTRRRNGRRWPAGLVDLERHLVALLGDPDPDIRRQNLTEPDRRVAQVGPATHGAGMPPMTRTAAADLLDVDPRTVSRWVDAGRLEPVDDRPGAPILATSVHALLDARSPR